MKQEIKHKIVYKKLDELTEYSRNSRTHSPQQVDQIVASIVEFGFTNPILIAENGEIIAGHGRYEAALSLRMDSLPCVVLDHLSEIQRRAYVIADNQIALNAQWDENLLADELIVLEHEGFDLSLCGFSEQELEDLCPGMVENEADSKTQSSEKETYEMCSKCGQKVPD